MYTFSNVCKGAARPAAGEAGAGEAVVREHAAVRITALAMIRMRMRPTVGTSGPGRWVGGP
ncbi:hypothetical protein GCM10017752_59110 [Streptomyces roseoviridis]